MNRRFLCALLFVMPAAVSLPVRAATQGTAFASRWLGWPIRVSVYFAAIWTDRIWDQWAARNTNRFCDTKAVAISALLLRVFTAGRKNATDCVLRLAPVGDLRSISIVAYRMKKLYTRFLFHIDENDGK